MPLISRPLQPLHRFRVISRAQIAREQGLP